MCRRWSHILGKMFIEPLHHLKQVGACASFVAENESPQSRFKETAMKETRRDVSRNAELSSLQDDNPNAAGLGFLFFNSTMKLKLCRIEEERSYGAGFRPKLETVLSKV